MATIYDLDYHDISGSRALLIGKLRDVVQYELREVNIAEIIGAMYLLDLRGGHVIKGWSVFMRADWMAWLPETGAFADVNINEGLRVHETLEGSELSIPLSDKLKTPQPFTFFEAELEDVAPLRQHTPIPEFMRGQLIHIGAYDSSSVDPDYPTVYTALPHQGRYTMLRNFS